MSHDALRGGQQWSRTGTARRFVVDSSGAADISPVAKTSWQAPSLVNRDSPEHYPELGRLPLAEPVTDVLGRLAQPYTVPGHRRGSETFPPTTFYPPTLDEGSRDTRIVAWSPRKDSMGDGDLPSAVRNDPHGHYDHTYLTHEANEGSTNFYSYGSGPFDDGYNFPSVLHALVETARMHHRSGGDD